MLYCWVRSLLPFCSLAVRMGSSCSRVVPFVDDDAAFLSMRSALDFALQWQPQELQWAVYAGIQAVTRSILETAHRMLMLREKPKAWTVPSHARPADMYTLMTRFRLSWGFKCTPHKLTCPNADAVMANLNDAWMRGSVIDAMVVAWHAAQDRRAELLLARQAHPLSSLCARTETTDTLTARQFVLDSAIAVTASRGLTGDAMKRIVLPLVRRGASWRACSVYGVLPPLERIVHALTTEERGWQDPANTIAMLKTGGEEERPQPPLDAVLSDALQCRATDPCVASAACVKCLAQLLGIIIAAFELYDLPVGAMAVGAGAGGGADAVGPDPTSVWPARLVAGILAAAPALRTAALLPNVAVLTAPFATAQPFLAHLVDACGLHMGEMATCIVEMEVEGSWPSFVMNETEPSARVRVFAALLAMDMWMPRPCQLALTLEQTEQAEGGEDKQGRAWALARTAWPAAARQGGWRRRYLAVALWVHGRRL